MTEGARTLLRKWRLAAVAGGILAAAVTVLAILAAAGPGPLERARELAREGERRQDEARLLDNEARELERVGRDGVALEKRAEAARLRREAGDLFRKARFELERAEEDSPEGDPGLLATRGLLDFREGRYSRAREELAEAAAGMEPGRERARLRTVLGAIAERSGDSKGAAELYGKAIEDDPGSATAHFNLGAVHLADDRPGEALEMFRRAAELKPDDAEFQNALGRVFERMLRAEDAERAFERAVTLAPERMDFLRDLEEVRKIKRRTSDPEAAQAAFTEGQALERAAFAEGQTLERDGGLLAAAEAYKRAIAEAPGFHAAYFRRGVCLAAHGAGRRRFEERKRFLGEAIDHFEAALGIRPGHEPYLFALAQAHRDLGHVEEAAGALRRVLEENPRSGQAHYALAELYAYTLEDVKRAREELAKAEELGVRPDPAFLENLDRIESGEATAPLTPEEEAAESEAKAASSEAEVLFAGGEYLAAAEARVRAYRALARIDRPEFVARRAREAWQAGLAYERARHLEEAVEWYLTAARLQPRNGTYAADAHLIEELIKNRAQEGGGGEE
jgi:tetratricopeptide (TPR) repeat protein